MLRTHDPECQGGSAAGRRGAGRLATRLADLVVLCLGMAAVLTVAEMAVRPFYAETPRLLRPQVHVRHSPRFGWEPTPDPKAMTFDRPAPINERGLRGRLVPYPRTDSLAVRWLVLGGGTAFGVGVSDSEAFAARAAAAESRRLGRRVEVVNAGCEGYDLHQSLCWLDREGRYYAPRTILVVFDPEDLAAAEIRDTLFTSERFARVAARLNRQPDLDPSFYDTLRRKLRLLDFVDGRVRTVLRLGRRVPPAAVPGSSGALAAPSSLEAAPPGAGRKTVRSIDLLLGRDTPAVEGAWRTVSGELFRLAGVGRSLRADVYLVALPLPPQLRRSYPRERYQSRLRGLCADNDIVMVDPMEPLRLARGRLTRLYLPRLPFLNAEGHRIVGEALARLMATPEVERRGWKMPSQLED